MSGYQKPSGFDAMMAAMSAASIDNKDTREQRAEAVRMLEAEAAALQEMSLTAGWALVVRAFEDMRLATHRAIENETDAMTIVRLSSLARVMGAVIAHPEARIETAAAARIEFEAAEKERK